MREFLEDLMQRGLAQGNLLGLLNVLIGRRIARADGSTISAGLTWRETAGWLKKLRWDKDAVVELGLDPAQLPIRDRERYWYSAIGQAHVDSPQAVEAGDKLAAALRAAGYVVK
ncbi:MAG: hypothetical protein JNM56_22300 [Planctomycetia bacterium]|nr:hypothetical protein [Planctomycetia bacterium]